MTQIWNLSKIEIMVTHCEDIASLHYKFCKSQSHTTQPILYKVNVWKWNHVSFLLNEHHDNIFRKSLGGPGEITPFPPLSAPARYK